MHIKGWFWRIITYFYSMLYAKMFYGRDKMKHGKEAQLT